MDYANGKIYKITGGGMTYYGSTTQPLSKRFYGHKSKKNYNHTLSSKIIETGEAVIVLVELYPCKSREELFSRERFFIENNECINKNIPMRTRKEYKFDNKEYIKERDKTYYENNKEKFREYRENNKEKIKEWRENNKEQISEKRKKYYEKNK